MDGVYLRLFVLERQRHQGVPLYRWLLEQAKRLGIGGGAAFREIAGYGRHDKLHAYFFFELAGDVPIEVVFVSTDELTGRLMKLLEAEQLSIFYIKSSAEYGYTWQAPKP